MITPAHPHLSLARALTRNEMLEVLHHEGMFGLYERDLPTARALVVEGLAVLDDWGPGRGWHLCLAEAGR